MLDQLQQLQAWQAGVRAALAGHAPTHNPWAFATSRADMRRRDAWRQGHEEAATADASGVERLILTRALRDTRAQLLACIEAPMGVVPDGAYLLYTAALAERDETRTPA